jgi:hypothetical protein
MGYCTKTNSWRFIGRGRVVGVETGSKPHTYRENRRQTGTIPTGPYGSRVTLQSVSQRSVSLCGIFLKKWGILLIVKRFRLVSILTQRSFHSQKGSWIFLRVVQLLFYIP